MTYIVNQNCIKCKLMDCVEVCPVDCFYEGENMLVIKPDECIDCGVCEPECPIDRNQSLTLMMGQDKWVGNLIQNTVRYGRTLQRKEQSDVPQDQEKWREVSKNKLNILQ